MKKVILFAVLAVALAAVPASASVQNIKVSGDIDSTYVGRHQFDLGSATAAQDFDQSLFVTQTRLRVDADLTDNVSATVALINERVWGEDQQGSANGENDIDLNLAFVTLREMLYSPLTVVAGRQEFAFGNSFVIDSAGTNNTVSAGGLKGVAEDLSKRTALDAVRLIFDYNPLTIDVVGAKVGANNSLGTGAQADDVDLLGINANYELGDDLQTVFEAYFWAKIDRSANTTADAGTRMVKTDTVYMPGMRASANVLDGLNLQGEIAWQGGNKAVTDTSTSTTADNVRRRAMAIQTIANYSLPFEKIKEYKPMVTTVYTYVSGDSNPDEAYGDPKDRYTAWDPMFENQGGGTIYNTLFDLSNAHILSIMAQASPMEDVTTTFSYHAMFLDKKLEDGDENGLCSGGPASDCLAIRQPDGTTINPNMTSNSKIGDEIDVQVKYDYTEDVQFGLNAGMFFPGGAFSEANDKTASQLLLNGSVMF